MRIEMARQGHAFYQPFGSSVSGMKGADQDRVAVMFQNQIAQVQERIAAVGDNEYLSVEEKKIRREELEESLAELQAQLSQHMVAKRKEESDKLAEKTAEAIAEQEEQYSPKKDEKETGMSDKAMHSLMKAENAMSEVGTKHRVKVQLESELRRMEAQVASGYSSDFHTGQIGTFSAKIAAIESDMMQQMGRIGEELEKDGKTLVEQARERREDKVQDPAEQQEEAAQAAPPAQEQEDE